MWRRFWTCKPLVERRGGRIITRAGSDEANVWIMRIPTCGAGLSRLTPPIFFYQLPTLWSYRPSVQMYQAFPHLTSPLLDHAVSQAPRGSCSRSRSRSPSRVGGASSALFLILYWKQFSSLVFILLFASLSFKNVDVL